VDRAVIYPGSFDPWTNGHLDIVKRASRLFDQVVVAVANNSQKRHLFTLEERMDMVRESTMNLSNVEVDALPGLLADYMDKVQGLAVVRGLRAVSDFEFEFQLALTNRRLNERVETIFMTPSETYTFLSSSIVREIASLGGNVSSFVPKSVELALKAKFPTKSAPSAG
jgi:pantetheine-phosphate adenylyltransferase